MGQLKVIKKGKPTGINSQKLTVTGKRRKEDKGN